MPRDSAILQGRPGAVTPPPAHQHRSRHWVLQPRLFWTRWTLLDWDATAGVWRIGRRVVTPEQARQRGWSYAGPALSPRDLEHFPRKLARE